MNRRTIRPIRQLVYLASPFTDEDGYLMEQRANQVSKAAGYFIQKGYNVFCPIAHSHHIAKNSELEAAGSDEAHLTWMRVDLAVLEKCDTMFVYMLPGWDTSKGVGIEIQYCIDNQIPISYYDEQGKLVKWFQSVKEEGADEI